MSAMMNPNAHDIVLDILHRAVSQNTEILKPAEEKLSNLETTPGFYVILKDVFCNHSIDINVRLLAIVYFKNGIERYWRPNAPNAIPETEKQLIRPSLLNNLNDPVRIIVTHLAVLIAKIARFDCPKQWPELIPTLLKAITSSDPQVQTGSLMVLHQTVKILSAKRLPIDRRMFHELTSYIYLHIHSTWDNHCQGFTAKIQETREEAIAYLEKALIALKILEKLTIHGFKQPHEHEIVNNFMNSLFFRAKMMLQCRKSLLPFADDITSKFVLRCTNIILTFLDTHPLSFVEFIPASLEFAVIFAFTDEGEAYCFERFLIQCFNLIRDIIVCREYRVSKIKQVIHNTSPRNRCLISNPLGLEATNRAHSLKQTFFDDNTLIIICKKLVTHYFLLTPQELELWDSDPETFALDEGGDASKYSLRPSIETLFSSLFHEYRGILAPIVVDLVRDHSALVSPNDLQAILNKDGIYNAVGIAAYNLYEEVDFDKWFTTTLLEELKVPDSNYRIIRRRVIWLIVSWIDVKLSGDLHSIVYAAMIPLLKPGEDMVVRLTAANVIKTSLSSYDFNVDVFLKYLEPMFYSLFTLLKEAQQCDTKMKVLNVLCYIVERVGVHIEPYYNNLAQYLPLLWQESEPHNMLRCAVVAALVSLVKAIGKINDSEDIYNFILSIISVSTDVKQPCHVYLLEDGLELWLALVENLSAPTPGVILLFKNMPPLLEGNSEYLRLCLTIVSVYVLLAPDTILSMYGESLVRCLIDIITEMNFEAEVTAMGLLELLLKVNCQASSNLIKPLLPRIFELVYSGDSHNECKPQRLSCYLSIISRILMESQDVFVEVVRKVSSSVGKSEDEFLRQLIDVWLDKMPLVTQLEKKKLLAMALCSLLTSNNLDFIYDKFCGILLAIAEALSDISVSDGNGARKDYLIVNESTTPEELESDETEHYFREKQILLKDPVHVIVLEEYFTSKLQELRSRLDPSQFEQFILSVDAETLDHVREYVAL